RGGRPVGRAAVLAVSRARFRHRPRLARGARGHARLVRRDLLRPRPADRRRPRLCRAWSHGHASGGEDPARPSLGGIDSADRAAVERSRLRAVGARADQVVGHPVDVPDLRHRRRLGAHHRREDDESARPVRFAVGRIARVGLRAPSAPARAPQESLTKRNPYSLYWVFQLGHTGQVVSSGPLYWKLFRRLYWPFTVDEYQAGLSTRSQFSEADVVGTCGVLPERPWVARLTTTSTTTAAG